MPGPNLASHERSVREIRGCSQERPRSDEDIMMAKMTMQGGQLMSHVGARVRLVFAARSLTDLG